MRLASPCLAMLGVFLLAGCGGASSDDTATASPAPTTPAATVSAADGTTPADGTTNPEATTEPTVKPRTENEIPKAGSDDFSAAPAAQGDDTERVPASDGLTLDAGPRASTSWALTAKDNGGDGFCVSVQTRGVTDPDPFCHSGTQLALSFFTDQADAHALADVDSIAPSKTSKPTDIVVAGVATPDVKSVVVAYAGRTFKGQVTRHSVRLPVDKALAKEILDPTPEQLRSLPSSVTVRAFAVTLPATESAPPNTATARTAVPDKSGRIAFDLS